MADSLSIWVPFFSAMGGGIITIAAQYFSDQRRLVSEERSRNENRREKLLLRRLELQHQFLIQLQDEMEILSRETGRTVVEYKRAKTETERSEIRAGFMDSTLTQSQTKILKIRHRIFDDVISNKAKELVKESAAITYKDTDAKNSTVEFGAKLSELYDLLGERMKLLDTQILNEL